jgi:hypothetical protein
MPVEIFVQAGAIGLCLALIWVLYHIYREDKKMWTNHLSGLIKQNTEALEKLSEAINNLREHCRDTVWRK